MHMTYTTTMSLLLVIFMTNRYQILVDAWGWSSKDKAPCDEIKYNLDPKFLLNNYIDFYWNPEKYMSEKAVQDCHLKYASYHDIDLPPSSVKNTNTFTWISFVGDSVLREVFLSAVQTLTNYIPKKRLVPE